jgi:hypothetical protein
MAAEAKLDAAVVTEKSFDEFHLYTLGNPRDPGGTRRPAAAEFVREMASRPSASTSLKVGITSAGVPAAEQPRSTGEFKNSEAEEASASRCRRARCVSIPRTAIVGFEFVGENRIDHTPKNETIRVP